MDTAFCIASYFNYEKADNDPSSLFRFALSSRRLLQTAWENMLQIQSDTTHKITIMELSAYQIGFPDRNNHFHLLLLGISQGETSVDFEWFFKVLMHYRPTMIVKTVLSDSAGAIYNGAFTSLSGYPIIDAITSASASSRGGQLRIFLT